MGEGAPQPVHQAQRARAARRASSEAAAQAGGGAAREMTDEEREFLSSLTELVNSAQELSYALAAMDSDAFTKTPELKELLEAARNVVRAVWKFHRLVKTRMGVAG